MESRKRLYKNTFDAPTLTDRIKKNKTIQKSARFDRFAVGRKIDIDVSPEPESSRKVQHPKASTINDRKQKLKAYRIQKNSEKLKKLQEQKSPFILAVPVGRWVEKKERSKPLTSLNTPLRPVSRSERIVQKSTVRKFQQKSHATKENIQAETLTPVLKESPIQITEDEKNETPEKPEETSDLDSTFVITPGSDDNGTEEIAPVPLPESVEEKQIDPKESKRLVKKPSKKQAAVPKSVPATLIEDGGHKRSKRQAKPSKDASIETNVKSEISTVKAIAPKQKPVKSSKKDATVTKSVPVPLIEDGPKTSKRQAKLSKELSNEATIPAEVPSDKAAAAKQKPAKSEYSQTYTFYSTSLATQDRFLKIQLEQILNSKDMIYDGLLDDEQILINKTIQQVNLLINDKFGKFKMLLEQYEADQSSDKKKRLTEDDVESYWFLIYEEIDLLKKDLNQSLELINGLLKAHASAKRRKNRKTVLPQDWTPKRSKRIADNADTPKHNSSCYGCVTLSASKANTPSKRRTTMKKSALFDTPKRGDNRRSSKRYNATPKRVFLRTDAIDSVEDDLDF